MTMDEQIDDLRRQLAAAQEKIRKHEEWLARDSQHAENQRLKADLANSECIRHAEKDILIAEIVAHAATRITVHELRAINVEPGISLGKAREWKVALDAEREWKDLHRIQCPGCDAVMYSEGQVLSPGDGGEELSVCGACMQRVNDLELDAARLDTERFDWYFSDSDKRGFLNESYMRGMAEHWTLDQWRTAIDDARKRSECLGYENDIEEVCAEDYSLKETFDSMTKQIDALIAEVERADKIRVAATGLVKALSTCHICGAELLLAPYQAHCEDHSGDCGEHEGPECTPVDVLYRKLCETLGEK